MVTLIKKQHVMACSMMSRESSGDTTAPSSSVEQEELVSERVEEFEETADIKNQRKKKKKCSLTICLTNCKYDSVRRVAKRFGMRVVNDDEEWTIYWTDLALPERVNEIKPFQKVNHFPGMNEICRKDLLARNMNRMLKLFPKEYNCFPRTWTLPADFGDFQAYCQSKKNKVFIAKPGSGCQGRGIFLFRNLKDITPGDHLVCQQYISKPFTVDKYKFDLRIYILVTSCDPLRIYSYRDGLVRLGTVKYKEPTGNNMDELCMHLTNYAINKHSKDFVRDEESGSKRRITTLNKWFIENGYDTKKIWSDIDDVVIKTLIASHPVVYHNYRTSFPNHTRGSACFEILGFDILLDRKLKPWLMEVNRSPSFHTDSALDKEIKEALIYDTFNLIDLFANDKRRCIEEERQRARDRLLYRQRSKESSIQDKDIKAQYIAQFEKYERDHLGAYRRIYPLNGNEEKYEKFFNQNTSLCTDTIASRARADLAKQLREELEAKHKELEKYVRRDVKGKTTNDGTESPPHNKRHTNTTGTNTALATNRRKHPIFTSTTVRRHSLSFRLREPPQMKSKEYILNTKDHELINVEQISDDEELERIAALQLRDSIVRSMGVPEHLRSLLESQPNSRVHTPLPQARRDDHTPYMSDEFISRSSYQLLNTPRDDIEGVSAYVTPEHKVGLPEGVVLSQLPGYTHRRYRYNQYGWSHNQQRLPLGIQDNHQLITSYQPPTLTLYGNGISLNKGIHQQRKLSGRNIPVTERQYHYTNTFRYPVSQQGLTIRGLSVSDRVKHLKYLSSAHIPP